MCGPCDVHFHLSSHVCGPCDVHRVFLFFVFPFFLFCLFLPPEIAKYFQLVLVRCNFLSALLGLSIFTFHIIGLYFSFQTDQKVFFLKKMDNKKGLILWTEELDPPIQS